MRIRYESLAALFDLVYLALMTNVMLVLGCAPLVAGLVATDPTRSWPLLALVAPLCAPAACGAFAVFSAYSAHRSTTVVRTFVRTWLATWRRAVAVGALGSVALVVLGVDVRAVWGRPVGAVVIPPLVVLMVLALATGLLALVALAERPAVRLRDMLRGCLYLAVRRWYLTGVSLAVLGMLELLLASRPAVALGLAAAPLLYAVWANCRYTLRPALDREPAAGRA